MTIKELIEELSKVDEDVKDYEVWFTFSIQLTENVRVAGKIKLDRVPENADVDAKKIYLKSKVKI